MDTIFFSYSRVDSPFVLKLAKDMREAGVKIWLDQLDIKPGSHWDSSIEKALHSSNTLIIILSKTSVASDNVMDEVSYAIEEGKKVIPILLTDCETPFRLRRLQRIDFTGDYKTGFNNLLEAIGVQEGNREKKIDVIADAIKKPAPVAAPIPVVSEKPKGSSKKVGIIIGALVVIAIAAFAIIKMAGGGGDEYEAAVAPDNDLTIESNQVPINTNLYYLMQNRSNDKVMALIYGGYEEGAYGYIVLADTTGAMEDSTRKVYMAFEGKEGISIYFNPDNWLMTDDDGILIKKGSTMETKNDVFHFVNYKDGYFQISHDDKNFVLGLQALSAGSPDGQKIVIVKNDNSPETQWKLIPAGE